MRIHVLAVGSRMPAWIDAGFKDYARRMPPEWGFTLREISPKRRVAKSAETVEEEGRRLLAAAPKKAHLVGLDVRGASLSTEELTARIGAWLQSGRDAALMIGGPDGLARCCLDQAGELWSLSRLTLPHALVRVIIAEQFYRASTLMRGHPYHR